MSRYTPIKGSFHVVGTEPDGDTIRFQPDDPTIVTHLGPPGQAPKFSADGTQINTRFEGIDALETHFAGTHQQPRLGDLAAERMLAITGFTRVVRTGSKVAAAEPPSIRGHVAANSLDSYGRMIAFVFGEEAQAEDEPGSPSLMNGRCWAKGSSIPPSTPPCPSTSATISRRRAGSSASARWNCGRRMRPASTGRCRCPTSPPPPRW